MSIKDNHSRRVTFDTGDELGDKIDKLTGIMDQVDNLNLKCIKAREEDRTEVIMIDVVMISEVIKIDIVQIVETGDNIIEIEVDQGMNKIIEEILEAM